MNGLDHAPRIAPGKLRDIGLVNAIVVHAIGLATRSGPPNVFSTLARHRGLFRRWLVFASGLMPGGTLPRADTELAILRVAHLSGCDYEWDHHERIGRAVGLDARAIAGARTGADAAVHSPRQIAILRAIDQLHRMRRVDDPTWAGLRAHLDELAAMELCLLVGHYDMLAMTINTLGIERDPR